MNELVAGVLAGKVRSIARMLTVMERGGEMAESAVSSLYPHTGNAHIVGITGSPGCGKSTLVNAIALELRKLNKKVGIIAVDPSSPFTGGALLGDRVRMQPLSGDRGIFIRSIASHGNVGGLSATTSDAVKVLDAAGFDTILVETVGAGQAEVDIVNTAHTTIVVEAPGMGDGVQSIKAGILEIADLLVVNKADNPSAAKTVQALQFMLQLGHSVRQHVDDGEMWDVPVLKTSAMKHEGIGELVETIGSHFVFLQRSTQLDVRETERAEFEVTQLVRQKVLDQLWRVVSVEDRDELLSAVIQRDLNPHAAAQKLFEAFATHVAMR